MDEAPMYDSKPPEQIAGIFAKDGLLWIRNEENNEENKVWLWIHSPAQLKDFLAVGTKYFRNVGYDWKDF